MPKWEQQGQTVSFSPRFPRLNQHKSKLNQNVHRGHVCGVGSLTKECSSCNWFDVGDSPDVVSTSKRPCQNGSCKQMQRQMPQTVGPTQKIAKPQRQFWEAIRTKFTVFGNRPTDQCHTTKKNPNRISIWNHSQRKMVVEQLLATSDRPVGVTRGDTNLKHTMSKWESQTQAA